MRASIIHLRGGPVGEELPQCMVGRRGILPPAAGARVLDFDEWRWLPRQAQCKRCWRGKAKLHAPDDLVAGIEALMLEFQRLRQEHACWHDPERIACTCGSVSWTHPTAHFELCFEGFVEHLRRTVAEERLLEDFVEHLCRVVAEERIRDARQRVHWLREPRMPQPDRVSLACGNTEHALEVLP